MLADQDKIQKRFKKNFHALSNRNPEMDRIEEKWAFLSAEDKKTIYSMVEVMAGKKR